MSDATGVRVPKPESLGGGRVGLGLMGQVPANAVHVGFVQALEE